MIENITQRICEAHDIIKMDELRRHGDESIMIKCIMQRDSANFVILQNIIKTKVFLKPISVLSKNSEME